MRVRVHACVGECKDVLPLVNLRPILFLHTRSCIVAEWARSVLFVCLSVCVCVRAFAGYRLMAHTAQEEQRHNTCSILLSGFSSSGVKITSSLIKPYSPSCPENTLRQIGLHKKYPSHSVEVKSIAMQVDTNTMHEETVHKSCVGSYFQ